MKKELKKKNVVVEAGSRNPLGDVTNLVNPSTSGVKNTERDVGYKQLPVAQRKPSTGRISSSSGVTSVTCPSVTSLSPADVNLTRAGSMADGMTYSLAPRPLTSQHMDASSTHTQQDGRVLSDREFHIRMMNYMMSHPVDVPQRTAASDQKIPAAVGYSRVPTDYDVGQMNAQWLQRTVLPPVPATVNTGAPSATPETSAILDNAQMHATNEIVDKRTFMY